MTNSPLEIEKLMSQPKPLEYEQPHSCRRHSGWSLVGFALALAITLLPTWLWWDLWRSKRGGATQNSYGISPLYHAIVAVVVILCIVGIVRGKKLFGIAGLVISLVSAIAVAVLVTGSPW